MSLQIDKDKTALLIMDVQRDICHPDSPMANQLGFAQQIQQSGMLDNLSRLLDKARQTGLLVVHVLIDLEGERFDRLLVGVEAPEVIAAQLA